MSIRRNTSYNLVGSIIPLAVSLITIPIYLELIGEARYGVLAIAWLLLGYFGLFDLGLGRATAQRIATLRNSPASERAATFWTALILNTGLGVLGGLLVWPIAAYFFGGVLEIEGALRPEVQAAVPWLVAAVPMATLSGVMIGGLQGRERFLELNLISVSGSVLFQVLPLVAAIKLGADLGVLLPAALTARLVTLLIMFTRCRKHILIGHAPYFAWNHASLLLSFGGWVTVTSFIGPMMVILDRFIIGAVSGAKAVTYYTVPFQLAERSTIISGALSSAIFPRLAVATPIEEQRLALQALRTLIVVMTPLVAFGILMIGPFLTWWLTPEFAERATLLGQIILLGFWVNSLAFIPYAQLQARGRPDLVAKCHLAEILPYLIFLYVGVAAFGLAGAAVAFSLRTLVDFILLAGLAGTLKDSIGSLLMPLLLIAAAYGITIFTVPGHVAWIALVACHILIIGCWSWLRAPASLHALILGKYTIVTRYAKRLMD